MYPATPATRVQLPWYPVPRYRVLVLPRARLRSGNRVLPQVHSALRLLKSGVLARQSTRVGRVDRKEHTGRYLALSVILQLYERLVGRVGTELYEDCNCLSATHAVAWHSRTEAMAGVLVGSTQNRILQHFSRYLPREKPESVESRIVGVFCTTKKPGQGPCPSFRPGYPGTSTLTASPL